jgi:hypothetical protein
MAKKVDAYEDCYGGFHKTLHAAELAEIKVALDHIRSSDRDHLLKVMTGQSTSEVTRRAIALLAERLPPLCSPVEEKAA